MPSPVGHSLADLCGYYLAPKCLFTERKKWLLLGSVFIANMADLDFIPGIILGDPRLFHHEGLHSITMIVVIGLISAILSERWNINGK